MGIAKKRCEVCGKWYIADARTLNIQKVCDSIECRNERKSRADKSWRARHPGYEKSRNLKKNGWAKQHPAYWKVYRQEHPEYRKKDNNRRRKRHEMSKNAARQDAIHKEFVEKLESIPRFVPDNAARQDAMDPRIDELIKHILWKEYAARQDDMAIKVLHSP